MGVTASGLPFPEDTEAVLQGAQAIKALAQAVENNRPGGTPAGVFDALAVLGAAQVPIAWNLDPALAASTVGNTNGRLVLFAMVVSKVRTCTGAAMQCDTAGTGLNATHNGFGLWQYAADGSITFLRDSGVSDGTIFNAVGLNLRPWNQGAIQLSPGVVYVGGYVQTQVSGTNALMRGMTNPSPNGTIPTNAIFQRSFAVASPGTTRAAVMKTWPAGSFTVHNNQPLLILY